MQEYVTAVAGFLVSGGIHSFDEVFVVAARIGIGYNPHDYSSMLAPTFIAAHPDLFIPREVVVLASGSTINLSLAFAKPTPPTVGATQTPTPSHTEDPALRT